MPNARAVTLIAERLPAGLLHPGDPDAHQPAKLIPLPGLASTGMPTDQAAHFAKEAGLPESDVPKLIAEAIVHMLETEGLEVVARTELEQLRAQVATPQEASPTMPAINVHCHCNTQKALLVVPVGNRAKVTLDGGMLKRQLGEVCSC